MRKIFLLVTSALISACSSTMVDSLTPDPKVYVDKFENSTEIYQYPVAAFESGDSSEDKQGIGLYWSSSSPSSVQVEAMVIDEVIGIKSISFKTNDNVYEFDDSTHTFTKFERTQVSNSSLKSFVVPYEVLKVLANADDVKFKITRNDNTYGVSTFGKSTTALINQKLPKFINLVDKQ